MARFTTQDYQDDHVTLLTGEEAIADYDLTPEVDEGITAVIEIHHDGHDLVPPAVFLTDEQRRELAAALLEGLGDGAADGLAAGVQSFLDSLPFMAPEVLGEQALVKLAEPLAAYRAGRGDD